MADTKVGTITHYYDKINVAAITLSNKLKVGDKIKFVRGGEDLFEQDVDSLQIEHEQVQEAGAGDEVGIKVLQRVKDGAEVYKIE